MSKKVAPVTRVFQIPTAELTQSEHSPVTKTNKAKHKTKKKLPDKNDLGECFISPDGGWAWIVCTGAGVSYLVGFSTMYIFGFIFRERLNTLAINSTELASIINVNAAISACSGLLNGPMFRKFTYRQVAIAGSFFIFIGLLLTAFCETFITFMLSYSILFGFGIGISISAASMALNTYFQVKRRKAVGLAWAISGAGPIIFPYLVTYLLRNYGVQGTVIILAAISLHMLLSALTYQPVKYHVAKIVTHEAQTLNKIETQICKWCQDEPPRRNTSFFSSRYLFQIDDGDMSGYEITAPATPMLARANDGWYGSKLSIGPKTRKDIEEAYPLSMETKNEQTEYFKPNHFKRERDESFCSIPQLQRNHSMVHFQRNYSAIQFNCTCAELKENHAEVVEDDEVSPGEYLTFVEKFIIFFDLGLLKNITFVNLVAGLTIFAFGEMNFTVLTPFILHDFGLNDAEISLTMSMQACLDIITRFVLPFVTERINWDNKIFFLIGMLTIASARTVLACTTSYYVTVGIFIFIGIGKGFRTVFWPLIIPSIVPLKRLPAATGLQLVVTGLFGLATGPLVGLIRDKYNYSICLHFLNSLVFLGSFLWILEAGIRFFINKHE